jgi:hypothetical protein
MEDQLSPRGYLRAQNLSDAAGSGHAVHLAYPTSETGGDCLHRDTDAARSGNAAAPSILLLPH